MPGFSFAPHEDDPTDVAVHPGGHYAAGITKGTAAGAGAGLAAGLMSGGGGRKGLANLGTRVGRAGVGALIGSGVGGALGFHHVDVKRRAVEQAYGAQDPFALQKMSAYAAYVKWAAEQDDEPEGNVFPVAAGTAVGGTAGALTGGKYLSGDRWHNAVHHVLSQPDNVQRLQDKAQQRYGAQFDVQKFNKHVSTVASNIRKAGPVVGGALGLAGGAVVGALTGYAAHRLMQPEAEPQKTAAERATQAYALGRQFALTKLAAVMASAPDQ